MKNNLINIEKIIEGLKEHNPTITFEVEKKEVESTTYYVVKSKEGLYIRHSIIERCSVAYYVGGEYIYFTIFPKKEI